MLHTGLAVFKASTFGERHLNMSCRRSLRIMREQPQKHEMFHAALAPLTGS